MNIKNIVKISLKKINGGDKLMSHFNEHTLEMAIMELFEQQGYS